MHHHVLNCQQLLISRCRVGHTFSGEALLVKISGQFLYQTCDSFQLCCERISSDTLEQCQHLYSYLCQWLYQFD